MSLAVKAGRALFDPERRGRAELGPLRTFYYEEIAASTRASLLSGMFQAYLDSYEPGAKHTRSLARALTLAQGSTGLPTETPGLGAARDPRSGARAPMALAVTMAATETPYDAVQALGIRRPHERGLMDFAHLAFVERLAPDLKKQSGVDRLLAWLSPRGREARTNGAAAAIAALLAPWTREDPAEPFR